jgi:transcriptional regulator with PAS, ATPase and Fis domain
MQRFDELGHSDEYAESCWLFAQVLAAQNKHQKARAALDKMSSEAGQEIQARGQIVLAQLLLSNDDAMAASRAAEQAAQSLRELGQRDGVAQALYQQSEAARIAGQSIEHGQLRTQSHEALDELRARIPQDLRDGFEQMSWVQQVGQHTEEAAVVESAVANNVVDLIEPAPKRRPPRKTQAVKECFHGMVGSSPQMRHVFSMIGRLGNAQAPILITGESGTGKELVAAAIRAESPRRNKPFVRVNAAAFAETLLESELFGHEKGAFTGAVVRKLGAFEQANGGTLFLDEIGDISPKTQVALLRVMQEREIRRVGGRHPIKVDVRILCATNRKLEIMVEEGSFRLDLYYRIKGLTVDLPPLRDRDGDLEIMCEHILAELAQTHGRRLTLSDDAAKLLSSYRWPGNVRELENVLRSVYFFAQGECVTADELRTYTLLREARAQDMIQVNHSVDEDTPIGPDFSLADAKKALEIRCIAKALEQTDGNITKAATLLGMKRPRLSQKIKEFGLKAQ